MKVGSSEVLDEADVDPRTRPEDGDSLSQRFPIAIFELSKGQSNIYEKSEVKNAHVLMERRGSLLSSTR